MTRCVDNDSRESGRCRRLPGGRRRRSEAHQPGRGKRRRARAISVQVEPLAVPLERKCARGRCRFTGHIPFG